MKGLDAICTNTWSNIPTCIVHAVNLLVEKTAKNTSDIEDIKTSLSDLLIKFQVKTTRIDSTLQEQSGSSKSFQSRINKELEDLYRKTEENIFTSEKKLKHMNELINELRNKESSHYGEFRKEIRDLNTKVEKYQSYTDELIDNHIDRIHKHTEDILYDENKKFTFLCSELKSDLENCEKDIKKLENQSFEYESYISKHETLVNNHTEELNKILDQVDDYNKRIESANESIITLSNVIEVLSKPVSGREIDTSTLPRQRKTSEANFISPLLAKIQELDEKIEEFEYSYKGTLKVIEHNLKMDLDSSKKVIEIWVNNQISSHIDDNFSKIKSKLEWLPEKSDGMKGMNVTEARLFMIESRIRAEEKARILTDQKLQSDIVALKEISNRVNNVKITRQDYLRETSCTPLEMTYNTMEVKKKHRKLMKARPSSSHQYRELTRSHDNER